jgi:hypothetical protein
MCIDRNSHGTNSHHSRILCPLAPSRSSSQRSVTTHRRAACTGDIVLKLLYMYVHVYRSVPSPNQPLSNAAGTAQAGLPLQRIMNVRTRQQHAKTVTYREEVCVSL